MNLLRPQTIREGIYVTDAFNATVIPEWKFGRPFTIIRIHGNRRNGGSYYTARKVQRVVDYRAN